MLSATLLVILTASKTDAGPPSASSQYFAIQVVDRQTGRGVPLVELRTTNMIRHVTDSQGLVAFCEPGLMDREVFFFVESHGYEFPKDGFGYRGTRLTTTPGTTAVLQVDRVNIAERLYRVTGQGIYRDSVLLGRSVPLKEPVLNAQVVGQDSVDTCIYHDRLFWLWGDTSRPSYPLGHFAMAGAVSDLPGRGGLDPAIGVNLEYFVDKNGFSRPTAPLKEPGLVWLDGLMVVKDEQARERMLARFGRLKDLGAPLERGILAFNDESESFEPVVRVAPDVLPYPDFGHAERLTIEGRDMYYFALPFPLAVRMRVRATYSEATDPNRYEVLTALRPDLTASGGRPRWIRFADLTGGDNAARARVSKALQQEKKATVLYDIDSGKAISPHNGSVYFNAYRDKWVMIFVQQGGESSFLGEVWYTEADTPVGPWAYARKVATHEKYSYYNPKQHPYFDQQGGRIIYFEGTYSHTFSGSPETATPRYDYNQIMYRLDLGDRRLMLPVAVYELVDEQGQRNYLRAEDVERLGQWDAVQSVAFYAMASSRAGENFVPIHARPFRAAAENGTSVRLEAGNKPYQRAPLMYALPADETQTKNPCIVPLYEYRRAGSEQRLYSTDAQVEGWTRADKPLCRVWKAPRGPLLIDVAAKPPAR